MMKAIKWVTANDIVGKNRNAQKSFRRALRNARLAWHTPNAHWKVPSNSDMHRDMQRVFAEWQKQET
jgi:hypothetical protein